MASIGLIFDWLGSATSGFHMQLSGKGTDDKVKTITFELVAKSGDGPYIPCMPVILLAQKLARNEFYAEHKKTGASPCVGFISKAEYLTALEGFDIHWSDSSQPF